jgi:hypothetical protein
MATRSKLAQLAPTHATPEVSTDTPSQEFFSIPELAKRWRCSRGTVYNLIRGEKILDFATPGHRGKKLVPAAVVAKIENDNMRVFR